MSKQDIPACMDCTFYNGHFCLAVLDPFDRSIVKKLPTEVRNDQMLCGRDGDWFKLRDA